MARILASTKTITSVNAIEGDDFIKYETTLFEVTEKVDGEALYMACDQEGKLRISLKNKKVLNKESYVWSWARERNLEELLKPFAGDFVIQGEWAGEKVQANRLNLPGNRWYIYDVWSALKHRFLTPDERAYLIYNLRSMCPQILYHVPVIERNYPVFKKHKNIQELLEMASNYSKLNTKQDREGLVFKAEDGSVSFKVVSNTYLIKHGL